MRRILVVDDDPHVCQAIEIWLKGRGYIAVVTDSAIAGLAALAKFTFDLMIVDVVMPYMRGFESIRLFHTYAPLVPLIAISGSAFSNSGSSKTNRQSLALKLGATCCLRKPFNPDRLLQMIEKCLPQPGLHQEDVGELKAVIEAFAEIQGREKELKAVDVAMYGSMQTQSEF
jgi:DNA-binding NtrC family response regulator